jgi:hypothetical protein
MAWPLSLLVQEMKTLPPLPYLGITLLGAGTGLIDGAEVDAVNWTEAVLGETPVVAVMENGPAPVAGHAK